MCGECRSAFLWFSHFGALSVLFSGWSAAYLTLDRKLGLVRLQVFVIHFPTEPTTFSQQKLLLCLLFLLPCPHAQFLVLQDAENTSTVSVPNTQNLLFLQGEWCLETKIWDLACSLLPGCHCFWASWGTEVCERGVRVRVITDCDYMALNGSQIGLLRKAGIQVRHDQDLGYMHHKFAIVDKKVLITGSLNWTTQAIQNNRENVLIMEDEEYVRLFLEEFERIWEEFNPTKYTFFPQKKRNH
ncbi:phospholipase d6 [Lynx pardinus]|uniref:Mitochondrial cardiolipin hydrolase n=1 Tax=Lynx pardinus TaxID=191816 RepID=A0A485MGC0_LYNPA|nr:phospholipase d6 [Lynx pardinus]